MPSEPFYATTVRSPSSGEVQFVYPQVTVLVSNLEEVEDVQASVRDYLFPLELGGVRALSLIEAAHRLKANLLYLPAVDPVCAAVVKLDGAQVAMCRYPLGD